MRLDWGRWQGLLDGGKLIGAIGCSGGAGSQGEVASKAGVAALK